MYEARTIQALTDCGAIAAALRTEHSAIEGALESLGYAVLAGANKAVLTELIGVVVDFCVAHFASEEQTLGDNGYSEIEAHAAAHRKLLTAFRATYMAVAEGQMEATLDVSDLLREFHFHIASFDEPAFAQFLGEPYDAGAGLPLYPCKVRDKSATD